MAEQLQLVVDRRAEIAEQIRKLLDPASTLLGDPKLRFLVYELRERRGSAAAVSVAYLAQHLGVCERTVKQMVKDLVEVYGLPVGASRVAPAGYYLAETPEEIEATVRAYQREAISLYRRIRALAGEQRMAEYHGQLLLEANPPKEVA